MAKSVNNGPDTLYNISISSIINYMNWCCKKEFRTLPDNVLFDLYYKMYEDRRLCLLSAEFSDLEVFSRMLKVSKKRSLLLQSFQALVDHGSRVTKELVSSYVTKSNSTAGNIIDVGLRLGGFLTEAGWFEESADVLKIVEGMCKNAPQTPQLWLKKLDCYHKLLHIQALYCKFSAASETYKLANETVNMLKTANQVPNLAALYAEFSLLFFIRSEYDKAYKWSMEAMKQLTPNLPDRVIVDVLRLTAKACVVKREFNKAGLLINQAVSIANQLYELDNHPSFADTLMDYGFYLLNVDSIAYSVKIYEKALSIRKSIFGKNNVYVAVTYEDLAYALYVSEYSSGHFYQAREHAERAIKIFDHLVPNDHLMIASAKRVKALILEEIALDIPNHQSNMFSQADLLSESEKLHMSALKLSLSAFGEKNVQTAKHYGNLGRLYQSMQKYKDAERMHLRAISIKEELLGRDDYEVGLSIGHLASLYNYHMHKHRKAEELYYRSIAISLKIFGKGYSGLEYDYRGLVHVYHELNDSDRKAEYTQILNEWRVLRDKQIENTYPSDFHESPAPIMEITKHFFEL